jgi:hypothetical protein
MQPVYREPFFVPATSEDFLINGESWVENNQQFRQSQKYHFYRNALDFLVENDVSGSYFEFGVHKARTFTMVMSLDRFYATNKGYLGGALKPQASEMEQGGGYMHEYVAFDSFEGFPTGTNVEGHPLYRPGHVKTEELEFRCLLQRYGQSIERVRCVKGFYEESLTADTARDLKKTSPVANLVTVDCNLYESYRDSLAFIENFIKPGSIIYLDDYNTHRGQPNLGPKKAWFEFREISSWHFEDFLTVGWAGRSFICCGR